MTTSHHQKFTSTKPQQSAINRCPRWTTGMERYSSSSISNGQENIKRTSLRCFILFERKRERKKITLNFFVIFNFIAYADMHLFGLCQRMKEKKFITRPMIIKNSSFICHSMFLKTKPMPRS